jgi:hypothetical protein
VEIYLEPVASVDGRGESIASPPQGQEQSADAPAAASAASGGGEAGGVASGSVERKAGRVKSCDHGKYALSYTMADAGRYLLYVKVAGLDSGALLCHCIYSKPETLDPEP